MLRFDAYIIHHKRFGPKRESTLKKIALPQKDKKPEAKPLLLENLLLFYFWIFLVSLQKAPKTCFVSKLLCNIYLWCLFDVLIYEKK